VVGPSAYIAIPDDSSGRSLRDWLSFQLKGYRPTLLVTHCDEAVGPAAWAAAGPTRVICHRYTATKMKRGTLQAATRRVTFVVHSEEAAKSLAEVSARTHRVDPEPLWLTPTPAPEKYSVGAARAQDALKISKHFEAHKIDIPVITGSSRELLREASVVVDLSVRPELNPLLLEARRWGRLVAIPEGVPQASAYGEGSIMFTAKTFYSSLLNPPATPEPYDYRGLTELRKLYAGRA